MGYGILVEECHCLINSYLHDRYSASITFRCLVFDSAEAERLACIRCQTQATIRVMSNNSSCLSEMFPAIPPLSCLSSLLHLLGSRFIVVGRDVFPVTWLCYYSSFFVLALPLVSLGNFTHNHKLFLCFLIIPKGLQQPGLELGAQKQIPKCKQI